MWFNAHPCPIFNEGSRKPSLKFWRRCVVTCDRLLQWLNIQATNSMLLFIDTLFSKTAPYGHISHQLKMTQVIIVLQRSITLTPQSPLDKNAAISQTTFSKSSFIHEKFCIFIRISLQFIPKGCNWQYVSIGSGNGLVPNRRQAITWTKADPNSLSYICGARGRWVETKITKSWVAPVSSGSTHWGNGSVPNRRQAITWTNADPNSLSYICGARGRWVETKITKSLGGASE